MLLLQSFDKIGEVALLNPRTGVLEVAEKKSDPQLGSAAIRGHYAQLNGMMICIFREDGKLHLAVNNTTLDFDESLIITFERNDHRRLRIAKHDIPVAELSYQIKDIDQLIIRVDAFSEEEDYDFGLFLYNLYLDRGRRNRIYTQGAP